MLKRLSDAASELFSSTESLRPRESNKENKLSNNNSFFVKSRDYQWDEEEDSIALSSDIEDLPFDTDYLQVLKRLEASTKERQFLFWTSKDLDSIPLRIDEIRNRNEMFAWMKQREELPLTRRIFCRHPDLTIYMRSKLINWLFEVALHFRLTRETLYLAFSYLDTFLAREVNFLRDEYQLLGLAAVMLASKVEEMRPPTLPELSQICDESFSSEEIAEYELKICSALKWRLIKDTLAAWLQFYADALRLFLAQSEVDRLIDASLRLSDLCLHSPVSLNFCASSLAAAILLFQFNLTTHSTEIFILSTALKPVQLESELLWVRTYASSTVQVAYVDPKCPLTDDQFNYLLDENIKALSFLHKIIKIEDFKYRKREEGFF